MTDQEYLAARAALSMQRYSDLPVLKKPPGERVPEWACRCRRPDGRPLLRSQRHTSEMHCVPQAEIDAWRAISGCGPKAARELYWMAMSQRVWGNRNAASTIFLCGRPRFGLSRGGSTQIKGE